MDEFESWYEAERPRVLAGCVGLAGDLDAARDATDEAFTRALERWRSVARMASPGGWTQTVALNVLRRRLRRRRLEERRLGSQPGEAGQVPEVPDVDLWAAVRLLPPRQQTAVVLRYVHDLSHLQVAECMGITRGAVASTLDGAYTNLRRLVPEPLMTEETIDG